jgi:hypothetical protein
MYRPYTMRGSLYLCPDQPEEWLMDDLMKARIGQAEPDAEVEDPAPLPSLSLPRKLLLLALVGLFTLLPIGGAFAALSIGA